MEAKADPYIEAVQQKLKEQGFYYGSMNGTKDAETTAAIRRYQIRNGLQITGELNKETQKSLAVAWGRERTAGHAALRQWSPPHQCHVVP